MASLDQMLSFAATARHSGFAGAARELGLSPSAVAKNVARWEATLGVRLFHRTTRQVTLTQDGRELYERCRRILEEVEALETEAAGARAEPRGTLRVDVPIVYGRRVVLPRLLRLAARHPRLSLDLRFSDRFADMVRDGLDAVVRVGELGDSGFVARRIGEQRLLTVGSPAYLAARGAPARPADLARHACLVFRMPTSGRDRPWQYRADGRDEAIHPPTCVRCDDGDALVVAALADAGLAQLPDYMVEDALAGGRLVEVLAPFRPPPMPISVVWPAGRHVPPRVRALVEALQAPPDPLEAHAAAMPHAAAADPSGPPHPARPAAGRPPPELTA